MDALKNRDLPDDLQYGAAKWVAAALGMDPEDDGLLGSIILEVAKGNLDARAKITSKDEIGLLGETFNNMTDQLNNTLTNLEQQVSERTQDIQKRATKLQISAEIARDATIEPE